MLPDLLAKNLKLVICGTALGNTSARLGQYYARPGNKFWRALFETGLTPYPLTPSEYKNLLEYGIGLTDLVKLESGMDKDLSGSSFDRAGLCEKVEYYQPGCLCFNGKRAAKEFLLRPVSFGPQPEVIGMTKIFVAPSTSGAASRYWDLQIWQELAQFCNR